MRKEVDERIVEMRFDNKQFESNVQTSMSTIDKLKQKLNFKDASKGLESINSSVKKVDMSTLGNGIEAVRTKFSAMEIVGVAALVNIANSAVNAGKRIVSALTIDPVKTGLQEYETQINAVQTILANTESKGSTLKDVNRALDELNKYADLTIYNFTEMTRNIGTFTAAGIELNTSVNAIKGIANLAAISGSNAQQASTAMYQLSQALASGTIKLMDWNSVVNAGMGGQVFQDAIKETARVHGIAIDKMIKDEGSFRETLKSGWLTSEVLTETLQKFTLATEGLTEAEIEQNRQMLKSKGYTNDQIDAIFKLGNTATNAATKVKTFSQMWDVLKESAQSGWSQTWKIIVGDFEESKALFTPLTNFFTNIIQGISDFRNNLIEGAMSSPIGQLAQKIAAVTSATASAAEKMKDYGEMVNRVINGDFGNVQARWDKLTELGYDWAKVQNLVNEKLGSSVRHVEQLTDAQSENTAQIAELTDAKLKEIGLTEEEITAYRELEARAKKYGVTVQDLIAETANNQMDGRTMLIESFKNIGQSLVQIFTSIKNAWADIFPPMTSSQLYNIIEGFHTLSRHLIVGDETADKLKRTFKGLFAVLDLVKTVVGGALGIGFKVLKEILAAFDLDILDVTANIGDAIVSFRNWVKENDILSKTIKKVAEFIKEAWDHTKEFVRCNEQLSSSITKITSTFKNAVKSVKMWITSIKESDDIPGYIIGGLANGLTNGIAIAAKTMLELGKTILNTIKNILGIHSPSTEFYDIGENATTGFVNGIQNGTSTVIEAVVNFGKNIIDTIKNIDFGKVFAVVASAGIAYTAKKFLDIAEMFAAPMEGLGKMFSGIGKMFSSAGNVLNAFAGSIKVKKWKTISKAILDFAIAIGILAASVYLLAQLDTGSLWQAIGALAALAGIITLLSFAASKIDVSGGGFGKLALMLVGISASLFIMASAIKKLEFLNNDNVGVILGGLAAMIGGLTIVLATLGMLVKGKTAQNIDKAGITIVKISAAMLTLTFVIKQISELEPNAIVKGIVCMTLFGGLITGLIAASKLAGKHIDKVGSMILKISAAMLLMVATIKLISGLEPSEISKGIICMTLFGGLITGLIVATRLASGNTKGLGATILGISSAMLLIAVTVKLVSGMEPAAIAKGIICMTLFGGLITGLIAATKLAGGNLKGLGITIMLISFSIGILAAVAVVLSLIDIQGLAKGIVAVGMLGTIMALLIKSTKGATDCKGNIIAMTVAVGVMAASMAALSFIDGSKLAGATVALSTVMGMFALIAYSAGSINGSIGPLLIMTVAVGMLGGMIYLLSTMPIKSVLSSAASLSLLLLSMSASLAVLSLIGPTVSSALIGAVGLLALSVPLLAFIGVLALMQNIQNAAQNALILGAFATVMSGLLLLLTGIGMIYMATGGIAATGILGLLAMAVPLVAFVGILALMQGIQNAEANANILTSLMTAMTDMLIKVSILGPLALVGVSAITAMTVLMTAIGGLVVGIGALVERFPQLETFMNSGITLLSGLANGLGLIIGNFISGFAQGVTSGFPEIATNLSAFMTNLAPFIEGAKTIDESVLNNVKSLAEIILILTGTSILDGIASWLTGGSSIADFGKQLIEFGTYIKQYGDTVAGLNTSGLEASVSAGRALADLASALPNSGGLAGMFAGENDIDDFGTKLIVFGESIKKYGDAVNGINTNGISESVNAGKSLAELADILPNTGGLAGFFAGNNDMDDFGTKLVVFGESIKKYGDAVNGINTAGISESVNAGHALAELADALPNSGGVAGFFAGNNDLDKFGKNLEKFGESLVNFSKTMSGVKLSDITSKLSGFGKSLTTLGKTGIDGFVKAFSDGSSKITNAAVKMVTTFINAANSKKSSLNSTFKTMMGSAVSTINAKYSSFYDAGKYVVEGFAKGITANTYMAEARAREMARKADQAARDELGVESPSRAFIAIGKYIGEGLAQGIEDSAWMSVNSVEGTAEKLESVASKSFDDVKNWVSDAKAFKEISLEEELQLWRMVMAKYGEGTKERVEAEKNAYSVYEQLYKDRYQNSMDWIEEEKYYHRLGLEDELAAYERVQATYAEGTEERKKADREIYRLKNEIAGNTFQNSMDWIAKEKSAKRLSLEAELEAYNRVKERYAETSDEYAQMVVEIDRVTNKINKMGEAMSSIDAMSENSKRWMQEQADYDLDNLASKLAGYKRMLTDAEEKSYVSELKIKLPDITDEEINEQLKQYRTEYKLLVYNAQKAIYEASKKFEDDRVKLEEDRADERLSIEQEYADKKEEIINNLNQKIDAAEAKYDDALKSRTDSLYKAYGLFDGVKEKDKVSGSTLMKNLQDQVNEFSDWEEQLNSLSAKGLNEGLIDELQEMGPSAIAEIKALNSMSDSELAQYATLWSTKHKEAKDKAIDELADLRVETQSEIKALKAELDDSLDDLYDDYYGRNGIFDKFDAETKKKLKTLREDFTKELGLIKNDSKKVMTDTMTVCKQVLDNAGFDKNGYEISSNFILGLNNGIIDGTSSFYETLRNMFSGGIDVAKEETDEHSPSKVFEKIGQYLVEGLVVGVKDYSGRAINACSNLGKNVIETMSASISKISDTVNNDMEYVPTIRPVVDLTNVANGIGMIDNAFNANRSMALGATITATSQNGQHSQSEIFAGKLQEATEKSNGKIVSAINSLREDFDGLLSKVEQMQVVMDTGALVGAIAPDMDGALGGLSKMNRRGAR